MSPERWQQLEPLLNEALDLPPDKRSEFLNQACNGNQSLRLEIEALLAQEERIDSFIEEPILPLPDDLKQLAQDEPPKPAPPTEPLTGKQLGKYKIRSLLGKGGMGEVYLAYDAGLDREVALKFLPPEVARDPEQTERFKREARTLAKLENHPNIAVIHDLELSNPTPFLVLEYVPGQTLAERLQQGALPLAEAVPLFQQIAAALTEAQKRGIIHRDLKPANIKITPDGRVKVLDFGLAKILAQQAPTAGLLEPQFVTTRSFWTTDRQVIMGTVPYMSPEQTRGLLVDQRTDIWAFGCLMFESLAGQRPFQGGDTFDLFHAIRTHEPDWQLLPTNLPDVMRKLLRQCLRKEPETRLASARETYNLLIEAGERAPLPQVVTKLRRWKKQLVFAVAASLVISLGTIYRQPLQARLTALFAASTAIPLIPKDKTLVVLPFREANNPSKEDRLGRGLAKALQDVLSSVADLRILPFAEALQTNLANAKPDIIAQTLGVNLLLGGEVQREGEAVTIRYWVQNKQGLQILSGAATGKSGEYAKLQADITTKVVNGLKLNTAQLQTAVAFKTAEAEEKYLAAMTILQSDLTKETIEPALKSLTEILQTEGDSAPVLAALSQAYFQKAKLSKNPDIATQAIGMALKYADQAIALPPTSLETELVRGQAQLFLGEKPEEAIQSFVRAREKQPSNLEAILGIAYVYQDSGQHDEAEKYFRAAVNHWPDYWGSHNELGTFWLDQGQFEKALEEGKKVIELNRTGVSGYINAGNACIKLGRYPEAEEYFHQALTQRTNRDSTTEEAYIGWGIARYYQGLYAAAAESFSDGLTINSKSVLLLANLGDALRHLGGEDHKAAESYQKAIALMKRQELGPMGYAHLAELFAKCSQLPGIAETQKLANAQKAPDYLDLAMKSNVQNAEVLASAALVCCLLGNEENAIEYIVMALQQGYSLSDLEHEPDFQKLRKNPRFAEKIAPFRKTS